MRVGGGVEWKSVLEGRISFLGLRDQPFVSAPEGATVFLGGHRHLTRELNVLPACYPLPPLCALRARRKYLLTLGTHAMSVSTQCVHAPPGSITQRILAVRQPMQAERHRFTLPRGRGSSDTCRDEQGDGGERAGLSCGTPAEKSKGALGEGAGRAELG